MFVGLITRNNAPRSGAFTSLRGNQLRIGNHPDESGDDGQQQNEAEGEQDGVAQ
jgi:hypothetical protein